MTYLSTSVSRDIGGHLNLRGTRPLGLAPTSRRSVRANSWPSPLAAAAPQSAPTARRSGAGRLLVLGSIDNIRRGRSPLSSTAPPARLDQPAHDSQNGGLEIGVLRNEALTSGLLRARTSGHVTTPVVD